MKVRKTIFAFFACLLAFGAVNAKRHFVGGDISLLPEYENARARYLDQNGKVIPDLLEFCYDQGMNAMRVRLFVNPSDFPGNDPNVCQDLDYIIPLCARIKSAGHALMLDFHYSDTWADPVKQWTPKAWQGLSDMELYQKIYDYTKGTLATLKDNGIVPDFIQTGNEISYGMLWGASNASSSSLKKVYSGSDENWPRFTTLLRKAIQACREECPNARIVLHTERIEKTNIQQFFYSQMEKYKVDYDIIGLSYYPYFHGKMSVLDNALTLLENDFPDKEIMIVETGYSYAWEVPGTNREVDYPYSNDGQNRFATDLLATLAKHEAVTGIFWWWMEYNAYGTSLSGWYNAPLFDSRNGRAQKALATLATFSSTGTTGIDEITPSLPESNVWYDLMGRPVVDPTLPGIYIRNGKKVLIR